MLLTRPGEGGLYIRERSYVVCQDTRPMQKRGVTREGKDEAARDKITQEYPSEQHIIETVTECICIASSKSFLSPDKQNLENKDKVSRSATTKRSHCPHGFSGI